MKKFLTFVAGIGVGVAISWTYHKNKYEEMVQEEVESLRESKEKKPESGWSDSYTPTDDEIKTYHNGRRIEPVEIDNSAEEAYEEELEKAKDIINYNNYVKKSVMGPCEEAAIKCQIHIITPEEFATEVGYDTDTFYMFEDNVITNDNDEIVDNVPEIFNLTTEEIRNQFGIYEDDSVYVRNEKIQMDYEILREIDTYEKRNGE